ncbi:hypothetical protein GCM10018793_46340 [Streptomyces sulfonofaciens]|uniref:Zinc finger CGNR domain-containing protein n=1 Tax=Streptomyces sulfonofaciens TaxID=68272 RepID=A0A919GFR4_9ACTN|nr:CGNR zinc finger domain-containing protein [Streptomyces sulfonofaciens]GHH83672.1 hypothetical protein GCM10018793_46340 [Streptomyces sulfonofaciens]
MVTRPLTGEPLALDLLNTRWVDRGRRLDALDEPGGVGAWLAEHGFTTPAAEAEEPLRRVRDALLAVLQTPGGESERALNDILSRGSVRYTLQDATPGEEVQAAPGWLPAWRAAVSYLKLAGDHPERIRRCGNPDCTLYFYDTSRNGARRWCAMNLCGNRLKASRHYERARTRS